MSRLKFFIKKPGQFFILLVSRIPQFSFLRNTSSANDYISFRIWFIQKALGFNRKAYWPMHHSSKVVGVENILIGVDTNPGLNPGCYIQGTGKLYIGDYSRIGANCGIMSGSHDIYDHKKLTKAKTVIGKYCWIGMNSIVLPGVELGDFTKVGAGSVVTKSFPEGYCVIAGNPAKKIKSLEPTSCIEYRNEHEYIGYIAKKKFEKFRNRKLNV